MADNKKRIANCVCGGRGRLLQGELGFSVRCEFDPGLHMVPSYKHEGKAISEWNIRQAKMDNLDRKAVCAYHKRTSYGKLQQEPSAAQQPMKPTEDEETTPASENGAEALRCITCGMLIPPACRSKRYCSPECAEESRRIQKQGHDQRLRAEAAAQRPQIPCAECGKLFPEHGSKKYCSPACSDLSLQRRRREASKRFREKKKANR